MDLLARTPGKAYSLAILDPPYGIGEDGAGNKSRNQKIAARDYIPYAGNDKMPPPSEYWEHIFRVSKNQIIFGANYFTPFLPASPSWLFWDKDASGDFADGELVYTSFGHALRKVIFPWNGMRQGVAVGKLTNKGATRSTGNKQNLQDRLHPNEKPIALYEWMLKRYAKPSDTILDTHSGSLSLGIACYNLGFDLTACELHPHYYAEGKKRLEDHIRKHPHGPDLLPKQVEINGVEQLSFFHS